MHARRIGLALAAPGLVVVLMAGSASARAQEAPDTGPYVGIAAGNARHAFGGTDNAAALFGGYRLNRFIALEASFADLGSGHRTIVVDTCPAVECLLPTQERIRQRRSALRAAIGVSASVPIGRWFEAFGRVGYGRTHFTLTDATSTPARDAGSHHADGADIALGARAHLARRLALRLEGDRVADVDGERPITTVWLGVEYGFGSGG